MRLGKVSGPDGALKVKGVKSRLMGQEGNDWVGHETAFISTNLMKNGMDAYALGDSEPGHNWLLISRCCFFLRLPWHCLA